VTFNIPRQQLKNDLLKFKSYLISDTPEEFFCNLCCEHFSGIWLHYKCQECINIFICEVCYRKKGHQHPVIAIGEIFKGIQFFLAHSTFFLNSFLHLLFPQNLQLKLDIKRGPNQK
jgi:hypothetical protein